MSKSLSQRSRHRQSGGSRRSQLSVANPEQALAFARQAIEASLALADRMEAA